MIDSISRDAQSIPDKYPALDKLGYEVTTLDNHLLGGRQLLSDLDNAKFNGCILEYQGRRLICYRAYSDKLQGRSNIFITELDGLEPFMNYELELPSYSPTNRQYEDARLFEHKGALYLSYVAVEYIDPTSGKASKWWSAIHVVELSKDFAVVRHYVTRYDGNAIGTPQKNWIYFSDGDNLYCIHDIQKHRVLRLSDNFQVKSLSESVAACFPQGVMRGGTNPVQIGYDRWLSFFHSSVDHRQRVRRYSMTPYIFSLNNIISIGGTIQASTENPIADIRATWWNPIVVFPMGMIEDGDDYLVSLGVNDLYNAIMRFPKEALMKQAPFEHFTSFMPRYFFWKRAVTTNRFTFHTTLKHGSSGHMIAGCINNAHDFAWAVENLHDIQWITEEDYKNLCQ